MKEKGIGRACSIGIIDKKLQKNVYLEITRIGTA
jgi:hypothetical protein